MKKMNEDPNFKQVKYLLARILKENNELIKENENLRKTIKKLQCSKDLN